MRPIESNWARMVGAAFVCLILFSMAGLHAQTLPGTGGGGAWLESWSFNDTNAWKADRGYSPLSTNNLSSTPLGNGPAVVVDSTNAAWLQYNVTESSGTNELSLSNGSLLFWVAPNWGSVNVTNGTGPGVWSRLIEAGSYTTNASYGWWSLYLDPWGTNIYFSGQTNNGSGATYLTGPIAWTSNRWHQIGLAYCATNSALFIDGTLVTNGTGVAYYPGPGVLTNGFWIGSDASGTNQIHGWMDDIYTYNFQLASSNVWGAYNTYGIYYYANPLNGANFSSAPSTPQISPAFEAITGPGALTAVSTNTTGCVTSSNLWITNEIAAIAGTGSNQSVTVQFAIEGGSNGVPYDVFGTTALAGHSVTNSQWVWLGQGYQCVTYTITNLPAMGCFLVLGTPQDSDGDGLTDAFELLVSKTDPNNPSTAGNGILDGWAELWGLNPKVNNPAQVSARNNFNYDGISRLESLFGIEAEAFGFDAQGNIKSDQQ